MVERPDRFLVLTLVGLSSCTGVISDSDEGNGSGGPLCQQASAPVSPLRRLTRLEYDHTVRDLLGDTSRPARDFAPDENLLGFAVGEAVSPLLAEQYIEASESLASTAVARLDQLLPCDPTTVGEDACAQEFIRTFGLRAYRRPLVADEVSRHTMLYTSSRAQYGFNTAIAMVTQAMLQSPYFLYRAEFAVPGSERSIVPLDNYEMASRLSYFLWSTMPDDVLFAAAAAAELDSREEVAAQARRMLDDPLAADAIGSFFDQWLELGSIDRLTKDPAVYPEFDDALRSAMHEETLRFSRYVVLNGDGSLETLLTGSFSFVNGPLASLYGLSGVSGSDFMMVPNNASERAGLLTHASILATHAKANQTSPIHRGKFIRERFFCQSLPPPPPGLAVVAPDPDPSLSTRQRFAAHSQDPSCAGCHRLMDPIGFGFENYDGIGRFRTMEGSVPVDNSGEILRPDGSSDTFHGAVELAHQLVDNPQVQDCVTTQWFRFALGHIESDDDVCSRQSVNATFEATGYNIRELLVALASSDAFRYRRVPTLGGP